VLGGDEFAILARQLAGSEDATSIALRVIKELEQPIITGSMHHKIGAGVGIALLPQDGRNDAEILRKADIAAEMDARIRERDLIERDLRVAVSNGVVQPYYQPLIDWGSSCFAR
jgi:GGDEF domain-containing protein